MFCIVRFRLLELLSSCVETNFFIIRLLWWAGTLLNALFSTKFPVMDASKGRHQTTKGLWLARDHDSSTLILDAEGTDSKERGEDRLVRRLLVNLTSH